MQVRFQYDEYEVNLPHTLGRNTRPILVPGIVGEEWRRGFEDCAEVVEELVFEAKGLN